MNHDQSQNIKRDFSIQQTENGIPTACNCHQRIQNQSTQPNDVKQDPETKPYPNTGCKCQTPLRKCSDANPNKKTYSAQHQPTKVTCYPVQFIGNGTYNMVPFQNASTQETPIATQYSCPCACLPPPPCPQQDDLWDLQYCRWWGWNWIRRREEMIKNQADAVLQTRCETQAKRNPYTKFKQWYHKKMGKCRLKRDQKKNLQNMYDTPCSSILLDPDKDGKCLKRDYKSKCTSSSTMTMQNKTEKLTSKYKKRKHKFDVSGESSSTFSKEICKCHPDLLQTSSENSSIEFLSLRMERVKSGCDNNKDSPYYKNKHKCYICKECSHKPKQHHKYCSCKTEGIHTSHPCCYQRQKIHFSPTYNKRNVIQPSSKALATAEKIPIFRKYLHPSTKKMAPSSRGSEFQDKHKEYKICCVCEKTKKKRKHRPEATRLYICCCKCCCCCQYCDCCCRHNSQKLFQTDVKVKAAADNCNNSPNLAMGPCTKMTNNAQLQNGTTKKLYASGFMSGALGAGIFTNPMSGKAFTLHSKSVAFQTQLPQPLRLDGETLLDGITTSKTTDPEHQNLLQAVSDAIMSSRAPLIFANQTKLWPQLFTEKHEVKFPRRHSSEMAMHVYDADNDQIEAVPDLKPQSNRISRKDKNRRASMELLTKLSYANLKKLYNERTFPFKKCRVGNDYSGTRGSELSDAPASLYTTESLSALETSDGSTFDVELNRRSAEYANLSNASKLNSLTNPKQLITINKKQTYTLEASTSREYLPMFVDSQSQTALRQKYSKSEMPLSPNHSNNAPRTYSTLNKHKVELASSSSKFSKQIEAMEKRWK